MPPLPDSVTSSIEVNVSKALAFDLYTLQMNAWYQNTTHSWHDPKRARALILQPYLGGSLIELYDEETGDGYTFGTVTKWTPPDEFVLRWTHHDEGHTTEVAVRFTGLEETKTRIEIEHRGWSRLPDHIAEKGVGSVRYGWPLQLKWFAEFLRDPGRIAKSH